MPRGGSAEMHELSIAQAIIDVVEQEAREAGGERVLGITVSVGELSGVVEEQLRFCFPVVIDGTMAKGAELVIERVEGRGWCAECESEYHLSSLLTPCPQCDGYTREVRAGQELRVVSIELD